MTRLPAPQPHKPPHEPGDGLPPALRGPAMLTIILGIGMSVLDSAMFNLALPGIVRDLQITESDGVWLVNAYQLAILVLLLFYRLIRRGGRKRKRENLRHQEMLRAIDRRQG